MKVLLTTFNAKYIHKNLALRWVYVARPNDADVVLHEFTIKDDINNVVNKVIDYQADIIVLSVYIWNVNETKQLIDQIKKLNPKTRIILGGPEVTFENDEWFDHPIEAIAIGEGEFTVWDYICENKTVGIQTKCGQKVIPHKEDLARLEQLENPYFLDFDLKDIQNRYLYLETSRGCPYGCAFCLSSTDKNVRFFSEEYLYKLFKLIEVHQVKQVKLLDRTFNMLKKRALDFVTYLNTNTTNTVFQFEIVADKLDEEMLNILCNYLDKKRFRYEIGIQSFHQPTLKAVGRSQDNLKLKEIILRLQDHQIIMHTDLIAGLPYEDMSQFKDTFQQLYDLNVSEIQVGILKLLKGTSLRMNKDLYQIAFDHNTPYQVQSTKWMSKEEILSVENVYYGVEKSYNNQRLLHTIKYLTSQHVAFDVFLEIGNILSKLRNSFTLKNFYLEVYDRFKLNDEDFVLKSILLMDYYNNTKQRPPRLFNLVESENKKEVIDFILTHNIVPQHTLYHYAVIDCGYMDKPIYQLIVYNENQTPCKRYCIDLKCNTWEEC